MRWCSHLVANRDFCLSSFGECGWLRELIVLLSRAACSGSHSCLRWPSGGRWRFRLGWSVALHGRRPWMPPPILGFGVGGTRVTIALGLRVLGAVALAPRTMVLVRRSGISDCSLCGWYLVPLAEVGGPRYQHRLPTLSHSDLRGMSQRRLARSQG